MSWDEWNDDSSETARQLAMNRPMSALRRRVLGLPPDDVPLLVRIQAQGLIDRLASRGIRLRLVDDKIRWSTNCRDGLTIAEMRELKTLSEPLKTILSDGGES